MPGRTTARGYGAEHQKLRRRWAPTVATGTVKCARCGDPIAAGAKWDLGHVDGSKGEYRGPEHSECNRATSRHRAEREQRQRQHHHPTVKVTPWCVVAEGKTQDDIWCGTGTPCAPCTRRLAQRKTAQ